MIVTFDLLRFSSARAVGEVARTIRHAPRDEALLSEPIFVARLNRLPFPVASPRVCGMFGVWADRAAADAFAAHAPLARRWDEHAEEHLRLTFEPVSSHGTHMLEDPLPGLPHARMPDGPVAIITHGAAPGLREARAFWKHNPEAVRHLRRQPGVVWSTGWAARPHHANTLSVWRSIKDVTRFAYGEGDHRPQVKRLREERWSSETWFARLRPVASAGTWRGEDPLALLTSSRRADSNR